MLEFDFIKKECYIYGNDFKTDYILKVENSHIIPCLCLYYPGTTVQVTKYQFSY